MARVTSEDCIDKVNNRFELVLLSAHRARGMSAGAEVLVERDNDKNPVIALREIAEEKLAPETLREELVGSLQKQVEIDEPQEDFLSGPAVSRPVTPAPHDESDTPPQENAEDMKEMSEDDILAALQALEATPAKDRNSD